MKPNRFRLYLVALLSRFDGVFLSALCARFTILKVDSFSCATESPNGKSKRYFSSFWLYVCLCLCASKCDSTAKGKTWFRICVPLWEWSLSITWLGVAVNWKREFKSQIGNCMTVDVFTESTSDWASGIHEIRIGVLSSEQVPSR